MWKYMQEHEAHILRTLEDDSPQVDWSRLAEQHETMISRMQHERLIHLLVTLFIGLFLLLVAGFTVVQPSAALFALGALLLVLTGAYVHHYYRLENGVQRYYRLADRVASRAGTTQGQD
jgi:hypothetical protein